MLWILPICLAGILAVELSVGPAPPPADPDFGKLPHLEDDGQGARYLQALAESIAQADRIVVTEHSHSSDSYDPVLRRSLLERTVVYDSRELDQQRRLQFSESLAALDPATQDMFTMCAFVPHHTVTFYRDGEAASSMEICFECASVRWNGSGDTPPWSIYGVLREFITEIGMQPDREWRQLALEHAQ